MTPAMPDTSGVHLRYETREGGARVAFVVLCNPAKLNALGRALMVDFCAMLEEISRDEALGVVVITGAGDTAFVGGADIDEMAAIDRPEDARAFIGAVHACCAAVRALPVPVIARIDGYALGAGLELAAACDLRVASERSIFGMPEVRLGIPSVVEAALLPMVVGWGVAREMLLLGETFDAAEALRVRLINAVVPHTEIDAAVESRIAAVLAGGPRAIRLQKALIRSWEDLPLNEAIAAGIDSFVAAFETDEPRTAMAAFQVSRRARRQRRKHQADAGDQ